MSDDRTRELEKRARGGYDPEAESRLRTARCRAGGHAAAVVEGHTTAPDPLPSSWPDAEVLIPVPTTDAVMFGTCPPVIVATSSECEGCGEPMPFPSERVIRAHMVMLAGPGASDAEVAAGHWRARVESCAVRGHLFDEGLVFTKTTEERTVRGLELTVETWQRCTRCEHTQALGIPQTRIDRAQRLLPCGHTPDSRLHGSHDSCFRENGRLR